MYYVREKKKRCICIQNRLSLATNDNVYIMKMSLRIDKNFSDEMVGWCTRGKLCIVFRYRNTVSYYFFLVYNRGEREMLKIYSFKFIWQKQTKRRNYLHLIEYFFWWIRILFLWVFAFHMFFWWYVITINSSPHHKFVAIYNDIFSLLFSLLSLVIIMSKCNKKREIYVISLAQVNSLTQFIV